MCVISSGAHFISDCDFVKWKTRRLRRCDHGCLQPETDRVSFMSFHCLNCTLMRFIACVLKLVSDRRFVEGQTRWLWRCDHICLKPKSDWIPDRFLKEDFMKAHSWKSSMPSETACSLAGRRSCSK